MDNYKKIGDSLAGRYFQYRIHPFDVRELCNSDSKLDPSEVVNNIMLVGGFPEPYLEGTKKFYNLWKKTHLDIILKQDLIELESVRDIKSIELLIDLLKKRVGSPISYSSLAEDLQVSDKTIKKWLGLLENMYVIFKLTPFHKNIAKSNLLRPKYYFFDVARVSDKGARLENLVACSLLKECHFRQDCLGEDWSLYYLNKRGEEEVDFALIFEDEVKYAIEVKSSDDSLSKNFRRYQKYISDAQCIQLVKNLKREKTFPAGEEIRNLADWLVSWK